MSQSYINPHVINTMLLPKSEQLLYLQLDYKESARREEVRPDGERCLSPSGRRPRASLLAPRGFPCSPAATIIIVHFWTKALHVLLEYFMACRLIQNKVLIKYDHKGFKMVAINVNTSTSNACTCIVHILVSIFMFLMFCEQLENVW